MANYFSFIIQMAATAIASLGSFPPSVSSYHRHTFVSVGIERTGPHFAVRGLRFRVQTTYAAAASTTPPTTPTSTHNQVQSVGDAHTTGSEAEDALGEAVAAADDDAGARAAIIGSKLI